MFFPICKCLIHSVEVCLSWRQYPRMRWDGKTTEVNFANFTWHNLASKTCYQELIYGPLDGVSVSLDQPCPYKGRDPSQAFLFEIVANKSCSIDVDKVWYWKKGTLITCDLSVWLSASRWRNDEYLSKVWLQVNGWKVHLYFVYLIFKEIFWVHRFDWVWRQAQDLHEG